MVYPALPVDHLGQLQLVGVQTVLGRIFALVLGLLRVNELLLLLGGVDELVLKVDLAGAANEFYLGLALDDLAPVDQSLSQLLQFSQRWLVILFLHWNFNLQRIELLHNATELNEQMVYLPILILTQWKVPTLKLMKELF